MRQLAVVMILVTLSAGLVLVLACDSSRRAGGSGHKNDGESNNGESNNGESNNGESNNGLTLECDTVCDQLAFCDIPFDDCRTTCEETLTLAEVRCVVEATSCQVIGECVDPGGECESPNACGGCGPIEGTLGSPCGMCGALGCSGGRLECLGEHEPNACGGCEALPGQPEAPCGECGTWQCDGADELRCVAGGTPNACGGCGALTGRPGDACGTCGMLACRDGGLQCVETSANACGGCGPLDGAPGAPCGTCGEWTCEGTRAVCRDSAPNACGGCGELAAAVNDPCGCGGRWICQGPQLVCSGDGGNGCGGCETLPYTPGATCECSGTFVCLTDGTGTCDDGDNFVSVARRLPDVTDELNMFVEVRQVLDAADDDWFRVHVADTALAIYDTEFILTPPDGHDMDLCAFYVHDDTMLTPQPHCVGGGIDTVLRDGNRSYEGCCRRTTGDAAENIRLDWSTNFLDDDSGTAFLLVERVGGPMECAEYSLQYRF